MQQKGVMKMKMEEMSRNYKSSRLAIKESLQRYKQRERTVESKHLVDITP
jgi:hypothetical protein